MNIVFTITLAYFCEKLDPWLKLDTAGALCLKFKCKLLQEENEFKAGKTTKSEM